MTALADLYLLSAWKRLSPGCTADTTGFPRGFWPDVARLAVEMALAEDLSVDPGLRLTTCSRGGLDTHPRPTQSKAKSRAENTAALLASLDL